MFDWLKSWFAPSAPAPVRTGFDSAELKRLIRSQHQRDLIDVDYRSESVTLAEVRQAGSKTWLPWKEEVWDCDDQARALINEVCLQAYDRPHPPAIGIVDVELPTNTHRLVWWMDLAGYVQFFDPTAGLPFSVQPGWHLKTFQRV